MKKVLAVVLAALLCVSLGATDAKSKHKLFMPGLGPDPVTQHSGYITVNGSYGKEHSTLHPSSFFILVEILH
jgi:hypothetical protein